METGKKILIIDDDSRNIFALNAVLKARKYNCVSATSAADGFRLMGDHGEIGLVLMDMMMPDMDGYEAIRKMKQEEPSKQIPVIAVTAQAMRGDRQRCLEAGADAYVSKPVNTDELFKLIKNFLE